MKIIHFKRPLRLVLFLILMTFFVLDLLTADHVERIVAARKASVIDLTTSPN